MSKILYIRITKHCASCDRWMERLEELAVAKCSDMVQNPVIPKGQVIILKPDYNVHDVLMGFHVALMPEPAIVQSDSRSYDERVAANEGA